MILGVDYEALYRAGQLGPEGLIRREINRRERHCRMCATEIDFSNDLGVRRQVRAVRYNDGKNRNELYAFCNRSCEDAYRAWEEGQ